MKLCTTIVLIISICGCNSPNDSIAKKFKSIDDSRGKVRYESLSELRDTISSWGLDAKSLIDLPDTIRALYGYGFKMFIFNKDLNVMRDICEADFPGLNNHVNLEKTSLFKKMNASEIILLRSSNVAGQTLISQMEDLRDSVNYQVLVIYGFHQKQELDYRLSEINQLFADSDYKIYYLPPQRFNDSEMSEYDFLSIRYKHWEDQGIEIPEIGYKIMDSLKSVQ
jgi:hypothetical protein